LVTNTFVYCDFLSLILHNLNFVESMINMEYFVYVKYLEYVEFLKFLALAERGVKEMLFPKSTEQ
jgi:hypothetical protein